MKTFSQFINEEKIKSTDPRAESAGVPYILGLIGNPKVVATEYHKTTLGAKSIAYSVSYKNWLRNMDSKISDIMKKEGFSVSRDWEGLIFSETTYKKGDMVFITRTDDLFDKTPKSYLVFKYTG